MRTFQTNARYTHAALTQTQILRYDCRWLMNRLSCVLGIGYSAEIARGQVSAGTWCYAAGSKSFRINIVMYYTLDAFHLPNAHREHFDANHFFFCFFWFMELQSSFERFQTFEKTKMLHKTLKIESCFFLFYSFFVEGFPFSSSTPSSAKQRCYRICARVLYLFLIEYNDGFGANRDRTTNERKLSAETMPNGPNTAR